MHILTYTKLQYLVCCYMFRRNSVVFRESVYHFLKLDRLGYVTIVMCLEYRYVFFHCIQSYNLIHGPLWMFSLYCGLVVRMLVL